MNNEPRHTERLTGPSRRKVGLETPIVGRFIGENRKILFAPPIWYDALVAACIIGSIVVVIFRLTVQRQLDFIFIAVGLAGVWAALSNERLMVDLRSRTYMRREGKGIVKRYFRGSLSEIDAVVLTTELYPFAVATEQVVIYRLLIHWKNQRQPVFVASRLQAQITKGGPINSRAGTLAVLGQQYASALGVPFFDNSYFDSPAPIPVG